MLLYSIKDCKAEEFGPIYMAKNDAVAQRSYSQQLTSNRIIYPDDYSLWCIGEFDVESGHLSAGLRCVYEPKSEQVNAEQLKEEEQREMMDKLSSSGFLSKLKKGFAS